MTPSGIYRATREACDSMREIKGSNLDLLIAGRFRSHSMDQIFSAIKHESALKGFTGQELGRVNFTEALLKSPEFHRALNECYPESARNRKLFYQAVLRAQRSGKLAGQATSAAAAAASWAYAPALTSLGLTGLSLYLTAKDQSQFHVGAARAVQDLKNPQTEDPKSPPAALNMDEQKELFRQHTEKQIAFLETKLAEEKDPGRRQIIENALVKLNQFMEQLQ